MPPQLPPSPQGAPDALAPGGAPWNPALPAVPAFLGPVYARNAPEGAQLSYSSAQFQGAVTADLGSALQVSAIAGLPQRYPFKLLLEWGTPNQEIVIVTSAPAGNGPYTFNNMLRGQDGGGPQITHAPGAQVNGGVSAQDFYQIPVVYNVCNARYAGGADPTGTLDSSAAVQAAVSACIANGGGTVNYPPGAYKQLSTVTANVPGGCTVTLTGAGTSATTVYFGGTGDCIRMYGTENPNVNNFTFRCGIKDLTIDGTSAGNHSSGIHIGDMIDIRIDCNVQYFGGTGSIGINFDNATTWTEEVDVRAYILWCTTAVVFQQTTGYNSFGYGNFDFGVACNPGQDGVSLLNGAYLYNSSLRIRGNFSGGASSSYASNAVLRVAGVAPANAVSGPGQVSQMLWNRLDIQAETAPGTYQPLTLYVDPVNGASVNNCYGMLSFNGGFTPASLYLGAMTFTGVVFGDASIYPVTAWTSTNYPVAYASQGAGNGYTSAGTGGFLTAMSDLMSCTLSGNITANLNPQFINGGATLGMPQRATIIIQQAASGGPYTVTWQTSGTPSRTSPNVVWPGGVTPQMSTAPGAVDKYVLETIDGATWYGTAYQASQVPDTEQFTCLASAHTLAANTSAQPLFNATANGALTAAAATSYFFEAEFDVTGLSSSTHTVSLTFGGTAPYTSAKYMADVLSPFAAGTYAAWPRTLYTAATIQVIVASGTSTSFAARLRGIIRVNAAGTVIPQVTQGTTGTAAVVSANSWFRLWPAGSNTVTYAGNWS